jgi:hypothetical protein
VDAREVEALTGGTGTLSAGSVARARDRAAVRLLTVSAGVVLVTVVAWLASLVPAAPGGDLAAQLDSLRNGMGLYRWAFVNAAVINPAFVAMLVASWWVLTEGRLRVHEAVGALLLGTYWLLPTLAYVAQFALLPRLLESGTGAEAWYFGNPASVSYWLAITGYGLFGVGAILVSSRFLAGGARTFGWVLLASGVASVVGLVGYALERSVLELGAVIGGALVVPLAVLALAAARQRPT